MEQPTASGGELPVGIGYYPQTVPQTIALIAFVLSKMARPQKENG